MASVSYQVRIFDRSNTFLTSLNDPTSLTWSRALSKAGSATFGIDTNDSRATAQNLQPFNRVEIWRRSYPTVGVLRGTLVWRGYIEVVQGKFDQMSIVCQETLALFQYRLTAPSKTFTGIAAGTAAFTLLTDTNAIQDTHVSTGAQNVATTIDVTLKRESVLTALSNLATAAGGAEYEIKASYTGNVLSEVLNFKTTLGTDKSASIVLKYVTGRPDEVNLVDYESFTDGKAMTNNVYAASSAGGTVEQVAADATSQSAYGLLEQFTSMNDKQNNTDLLAATTDLLTQNKTPLQIPKVTPDATKIDIESFTIGDTVRLVLQRGYIDLDQSQRIIAITVKMGDNGDEQIDVQLAQVGQRTLRMNILAGLDELRQRMSKIERGN